MRSQLEFSVLNVQDMDDMSVPTGKKNKGKTI